MSDVVRTILVVVQGSYQLNIQQGQGVYKGADRCQVDDYNVMSRVER
jgi:hypothetical protein